MVRHRRRIRLALVAGLLPALFAVGSLADLAYLGWRCLDHPTRTGFGADVYGMGTRTQVALQYRLFVNRFQAECRPDVQGLVNYRGNGDAEVVNAMLQREFDALGRPFTFYALDRPLSATEKHRIETDAEGKLLRVSPVLQIPLWIEGITVAYNPPCAAPRLRFSSAALSAIYSGAVTRWNDPSITVDNPALSGCDQTIRVAIRSDQSAQTAVFKDYLSKRTPSWQAYMQPQANRQWPPSLLDPCRGRGDAGMVGCVAGQPGSVGYVGFAQAFRNGLSTALVQNRSGFVAPSYQECTAAAAVPAGGYPARADLDWSQTSLTDPATGYAICNLVFALAFEKMNPAYAGIITIAELRTVKDFIYTAVRPQTQARLARYGVAPMPDLLRRIAEDGTEAIGYFE